LSAFTVIVRYRWRRATLEVRSQGSARPVARLLKNGSRRARVAYELYVGPGLTQAGGHITASGAQDAAGWPVGIVNLSGGRVADDAIHPLSGARHGYVRHHPTQWRVVQRGMPPLRGTAEGRVTRLLFNRLTARADHLGGLDDVLWQLNPIPALALGLGVFVAPLTFRFSGGNSAGFRVKVAGGRRRLDVQVDEPRLDRRLVLACVTALAWFL
jgi:hypothetical protein